MKQCGTPEEPPLFTTMNAQRDAEPIDCLTPPSFVVFRPASGPIVACDTITTQGEGPLGVVRDDYAYCLRDLYLMAKYGCRSDVFFTPPDLSDGEEDDGDQIVGVKNLDDCDRSLNFGQLPLNEGYCSEMFNRLKMLCAKFSSLPNCSLPDCSTEKRKGVVLTGHPGIGIYSS
jgi:hypothetical protein